MARAGTSATVYLGLGSNLGDRLAAMRAGVAALDNHAQIDVDFDSGIASLYETTPVGGPSAQPAYLNSAVRVSTVLEPIPLLGAVQAIEDSLGRVRKERWGERLIDIDLLFYEGLVLNDKRLTLPHPRLHQRCFVLEPLREIAPKLVHPVRQVTITFLAQCCREEHPGEQVTLAAGPGWGSRSALLTRSAGPSA